MRVTIDDHEVTVHIRGLGQMPQHIKDKLWHDLKAASIKTEYTIKSQMPIKTGRAMNSWGHWNPNGMVAPNPQASEKDAIWKEERGVKEMSITQGTNVPYVPALNAGYSRQAPPGFINLAEEKAKRMLKDSADTITREVKP